MLRLVLENSGHVCNLNCGCPSKPPARSRKTCVLVYKIQCIVRRLAAGHWFYGVTLTEQITGITAKNAQTKEKSADMHGLVFSCSAVIAVQVQVYLYYWFMEFILPVVLKIWYVQYSIAPELWAFVSFILKAWWDSWWHFSLPGGVVLVWIVCQCFWAKWITCDW